MNIYKLSDKQIAKEIKKFSKTTYGKIVMIHAYIVPLFIFLMTFVSMLTICNCGLYMIWGFFYIVFPLCMLATLITFIIGNSYFYNQLREFVKESKEK